MASEDGEPGDLYVVVHVKPNPQFMREGDDLWHVAVVTYPQAALGAEITVPTLEGPTTVKIHPGTQVGEVITLKGRGMPRFRAYGKGDILVRIGISVPEKLTPQQRMLLEELAKEFNSEVQKSHKFHF
jgi:molecular chaperone DnaJ